jgi:hypothetical protein
MIYMESSQNNQLITTLMTRMILKIAPHEMQLFQGQKEEYLQNPQHIINKRGYTSNVSGHEKILFLAPIIHNILSEVLAMLNKETATEFNNLQSVIPTVQLSSEKAKEIYTVAYEKAQQYQLAPIKAHLVADAVMENLLSSKTIS